MYNLYNAEAQFKYFLIAGNISQVSIRNYLSDLRHFYGWFATNHQNKDFLEQLNNEKDYFHQYYTYLLASTDSKKTVFRRLSTLRKFSEFLYSQQLLSSLPDMNIKDGKNNTPENDTRDSLDKEKVISSFRYYLLMNEQNADIDTDVMNIDELLTQIMLK